MATASSPTPAKLQALILQLQTQVATLTSGAATGGNSATYASSASSFANPQSQALIASMQRQFNED